MAARSVSVSALSDRMVRQQIVFVVFDVKESFSIRSFGSYGEAQMSGVTAWWVVIVSVSALSDRMVRPNVA